MNCCRTLLHLLLFGILSTGFAQVAVSQGIPRTLSIQGVLTDAFESKPLQGKYVIKTGVYESALGGFPLFEQMDTLTLGTGGLYQITLGKIKGLPLSLKFDKAYFIDLSVNGMPQTMRIPLQPAPYALMASNVADNAVGESNLAPALREKIFPANDKNGEKTFANSVGGLRSVIAGGDNNATTANYCSILGGFSNRVSGVYGTIGGGQENLVTGNYGFVGGGRQNRAQALNSSILAGFNNIITASANAATIGGGDGNNAGGTFSTISGGQNNIASINHATVAGGLSNRAMQAGAVVSGGTSNTASAQTSVVAGGSSNQATAQNATVSGGTTNRANGVASVVGGGTNNLVTSAHGGIFNGQNNDVTGGFSSVVGGFDNLVSGQYSSVGGGEFNVVSSDNAVVSGGESNNVAGAFAGIFTGFSNQITNAGTNAVISGGRLNVISGENASISGGFSNRNTGRNSAILGGNNNFVTGISSTLGGDRDTSLSNYTVITGGSLNEINVTSDYSSIGGGVRNTVISSAYATIAGGIQDSIKNSDFSTIAGGSLNTIHEGSTYSLIAGGLNNEIYKSDTASILSGVGNIITEESDGALIASGLANTIMDNSRLSVIAGGQVNTINKSNRSVIAGGRLNQIKYNTTSPGFSSDYSVIAGGYQNVIDGVEYAFIGGGRGVTISRGSNYSAILSGQDGSIGTGSTHSVIAGGNSNAIGNSSSYTVISGGNNQTVGNTSVSNFIGGGEDQTIGDNADYNGIVSGYSHSIGNSSSYTVISGGNNQTVGTSSVSNFIGGGQNHTIGNTANHNAIVSGLGNAISDNADFSIVGGGQSNSMVAGSDWSGIFSGRLNTVSGNYSAILGGGGPTLTDRNAITGNYSAILGGAGNVVTGNHGGAFGLNNTAYSDAFAMGTGATAGPNEFAATYSNGFYFKSSGLGDGTGNSGYDFEDHVAVFHNPTGTNGILIKIDNSCELADEKVNNDNNFVTFQNIHGDEVGRIEGQTIAEFGNDDEYQQELAFAILDVVVASTDVTMKGYQLVSDIMDVASASSCIFCPQLAIPETEDVVKAGIELGMSTAGLVSAGFALDNLINSKEDNVGVTYQSGAGDYAEYLPKLDTKEKFVSGQIVGVKGGRITKNTNNADQLMVISRKPIVLGNATPKTQAGNYEKVAFMGQVPVVVTGKVKLGDYILPDGNHKGLGIAISPENMKPEQYKNIVGIAWSESKDAIATEINVAVGLNALSISKEVNRQNDIIAKQDEQISMLKKVLCSMNTAMSKIDAEYASTVKTLLGNDANSVLDLNATSKPAQVQQTSAVAPKSNLQAMMIDDAKALAMYEKAKGSGHSSVGSPALFRAMEKDPEKKAKFLKEFKARYNQSIYEAMGKQSSFR